MADRFRDAAKMAMALETPGHAEQDAVKAANRATRAANLARIAAEEGESSCTRIPQLPRLSVMSVNSLAQCTPSIHIFNLRYSCAELSLTSAQARCHPDKPIIMPAARR